MSPAFCNPSKFTPQPPSEAEWEEERKWLNMTVYHTGPAKPLKVHEDRTVAELTQMAFGLFSEIMEGEGVPIERV